MPRVESQRPRIFYQFIKEIQNDLWLKFIRILGLPESELHSVVYGYTTDLSERKYQTLSRWIMYMGRLEDNQISSILDQVKNEINGRHESNHSLSEEMEKSRDKARVIYKFIEQFEAEKWLQIARFSMNLQDTEVRRLKELHKEDQLELKYQMILRWICLNAIDESSLQDSLRELEPATSHQRRPIP